MLMIQQGESEIADPIWAAYDLPLVDEPPLGATAQSSVFTEADEVLLLRNTAWFCSLRWLVIAVLLGLALLGSAAGDILLGHGIRLDPVWPLEAAGMLVVFNLAYLVMARSASHSARRAALTHYDLRLQIVLDLAALTVVIHNVGSVETYAPFMYLFHIVLACIFFPYAQSFLITLSAMGMYLACILSESAALAPPKSLLVDALVPARSDMSFAILAGYFGSVVFISGTVWYLASRLADALRQRDQEMAAMNRRLVAAMEERSRHMLRTTHQLKAPFAAIHVNAQLLLDGYCGAIPDSATAVIEGIATRCEVLSREIQVMLQLANLRSNAQNLPPPTSMDLPALILACLDGLKPQAAKRGIVIDEDLSDASVRVVRDHAVMLIDNVLSNAINYSRDGQRVSVSCRALAGGGALVVIRDTGIGIPAEKLPRIFEDYFRTSEAAQHNKESTGLGLAIVRQAALAGKIRVRVESAVENGTVFFLNFPASSDDPEGLE